MSPRGWRERCLEAEAELAKWKAAPLGPDIDWSAASVPMERFVNEMRLWTRDLDEERGRAEKDAADLARAALVADDLITARADLARARGLLERGVNACDCVSGDCSHFCFDARAFLAGEEKS